MDISRVVNYCNIMQNPASRQIDEANKFLTDLLESPESWTIADQLIAGNYGDSVKVYGAQLLKNAVKKFWNMIPVEQKDSIKNFMATTLIQWAETGTNETPQRYLSMALSAVIIREWPQEWESIVQELIASASSPGLAKCNLLMLQHISEDIKEFSDGYITSNRLSQLNKALMEVSPMILALIDEIVIQGPDSQGIVEAIQCLAAIVKWMDPRAFFESQTLVVLTDTFLPIPGSQEYVLTIFAEFANNPNLPTDYNSSCIISEMFNSIIGSVATTIAEDEDYQELCVNQSARVNAIIFMLNSFISKHIASIEQNDKFEALGKSLEWSVHLMEAVTTSTDVFRNLCEVWNTIAKHYYFESQNRSNELNEFYLQFMPLVRRLLSQRMCRPPQIIYTKEENGIAKVQTNNDAESQTYKIMHETLSILTHIDHSDSIASIQEMVVVLTAAAQGAFDEAQYDLINAISWSTGAISGAIPQSDEKEFVLHVLLPLLQIFEGRDENVKDRAILGSGIMFICSQYPRFLTGNFKIFKIIVQKLFEFMHENFPGVRNMAVSAFKSIADQCKRSFATSNGQDESLFQTIVSSLPGIVSSLEETDPMLSVQLYDALSGIITAFKNEEEKVMAVGMLMESANELWNFYSGNFDVSNTDIVTATTFNLRYNAIVADNTGVAFHQQFFGKFETLLQLYQVCVETANQVIETDEQHSFLLCETLSAVASVIGRYCKNLSGNPLNYIKANVVPQVNETIANYYSVSCPQVRVPEVITMLCDLTESTKSSMTVFLPDFYVKVYAPTVEMIKDDHESFVPLRLPLITLANLWIKHCSQSIYSMDGDAMGLFYGSIMWACRSPLFEISRLGIETMKQFFHQVETTGTTTFKNAFYEGFYFQTASLAFGILSDAVHKFAFKEEVDLIHRLLITRTDHCNPVPIAEAIAELFPTRDLSWLVAFISKLLETKDIASIRVILKDFLIDVNQYAPNDQELDIASAELRLQEYQQIQAIPGVGQVPQPRDEDYNFLE